MPYDDPDKPIKVPRFEEARTDYTSEQRSRIMRGIGGKDTKAELKLRKALWHKGYRYRKNVKGLPGTPDIAIKKYKLAIFVDGEFWHGHNWEEKQHAIKKNRDYWLPKIARNIQNDQACTERLQAAGWTVLRFWEQRLHKDFEQCLAIVIGAIEARRWR